MPKARVGLRFRERCATTPCFGTVAQTDQVLEMHHRPGNVQRWKPNKIAYVPPFAKRYRDKRVPHPKWPYLLISEVWRSSWRAGSVVFNSICFSPSNRIRSSRSSTTANKALQPTASFGNPLTCSPAFSLAVCPRKLRLVVVSDHPVSESKPVNWLRNAPCRRPAARTDRRTNSQRTPGSGTARYRN